MFYTEGEGMNWGLARRVLAIGVILLLPVAAFAQEAVLTGTVTDSTGAVLPGVTVTASNEATGNTFVGVTDERGIYRIPVRIGNYRVTSELQGFADRHAERRSAARRADRYAESANGAIDRQETVTVTGEAPLIDLKNSSLGGNIDARQVQELPVNGRNWMALALLAPGQPHAGRRDRHCRADPASRPKQRRSARVPAECRRPAGVG
jgi:hypothetical protein